MNPIEEKKNQFAEMCDQIGLSGEEKNVALAFLSGETGEETLAQIPFRDLSGADSAALETVSYEMIRKENADGMKRLFLLLFAAGQSTCHKLFGKTYIRKRIAADVDPVKMAAVYGAEIGGAIYSISAYLLAELMELLDGNPGTLGRILEYEREESENGKLVLLAAYFQKKYACNKKPQTVKEEDRGLLGQYETLLANCLCRHYGGQVGEQALKELSECILNGGLPQQFLNAVGANPAVGRQFRLVAGLAYFNYPLSAKMENIVKICMAVNWKETLEAMRSVSVNFPMSLNNVGGDYDRVFGIDAREYIGWALEKGMDGILREQAANNIESYLDVLNGADIAQANRMLWYIKLKNPQLHAEMVKEKHETYKERVVEGLLRKDVENEVTRAYLRGEKTAELLYPYFTKTTTNRYYDGAREYNLLWEFDRNFEDAEFFRHCEVYMLSRHADIFFRNLVTESDGKQTYLNQDALKKMFLDFTEEKVALRYQMLVLGILHESLYEGMETDLVDGAVGYFSGCLKERRKETLEAFAGADAYARWVGLKVLMQKAEENKEEILNNSQDGAEVVKEELFGFLCTRKDWEEDVKGLLASKKAAQREFAVRVLLFWQENGADYRELLAQVMEKEKSAKVRELLGNALRDDSGEASGGQMASREELVKSLHKGGRKRSLAWAYETPFCEVHMADGEGTDTDKDIADGMAGKTEGKTERKVATEEYLQAVLLCYASSEASNGKGNAACGVSRNAEFLAQALDAGEFANYVNELFDKWLLAGAESKKRWVLYAAAIHGGSEIVRKLTQNIREWPAQSRGAIACEAVKALSLSPLPQGLLTVDGIARKFKFKQVRAAAAGALEFAAAQLGITREELADRIVPDFGFDEKVERYFDYGERGFLVTITPGLELEVFEALEPGKAGLRDGKAGGRGGQAKENGCAEGRTSKEEETAQGEKLGKNGCGVVRGKKLKNLPAPGKKDDEAKAKAASGELKELKKQLKITIASQKARLEMALSTAREWSVDAWKQLFVKNPVMHQFAIGLIWGVYENGELVQSFRYMEDGSFNTEEEEEYELPEGKNKSVDGKKKTPATIKIRLVHPIELEKETLQAWKQQMEDYEITQPFEQLKRTVYTITGEEAGQWKLTRFEGRTINDLSLGGRLSDLGWYRGSVQDGGGFYTYYREDAELGLGVELHFSGSYVGGGNEEVTIYDARFYKAGTIERGSYMYDEADEDKAYLLRDIPARYFSEVVWQLEKTLV